ncbi:hypothetical protein CgunFtcFv8_003853 [Champsocephalus gunnari]|uniref:Uncharacterized protein n=1 Tax=Champsocephalus gunnari TaxID=52237 RepID=A0AAN8HXL8_CHAGU|nr:hypothetical protein CgunFtcFv8_003853 [Champsocephalus gunnari]
MLFIGCVQASCIQKHATFVADLRQLPLAGIAPERAHGPERAGGVDPCWLGGFVRLGLHVWVDLGGRGSKLSARHGSLPPEPYLQQRAGNMFPPGVTAAQRPTLPENRIPVSLLLHEGGGRAALSLLHHWFLSDTVREAPG